VMRLAREKVRLLLDWHGNGDEAILMTAHVEKSNAAGIISRGL